MIQKNQEKIVKDLITEKSYFELIKKIPEKFKQTVFIDYSLYILQKTKQEVLDFYNDLIYDSKPWSTLKTAGAIIILTSHINDLLIKLVQTRESDPQVISSVIKLDFHYLIIFCVSRYNLPDDYFTQMMELKYFRNMLAHNFNETMETSFNQAINAIGKASILIIFLINQINAKNE